MFGDLVREHRQRLSLSQDDLAREAGLGVRTIRDIEAGRIGRPRPNTVRLLVRALSLTGVASDAFNLALGPSPDNTSAPCGLAQLPLDLAGFVGRQEPLTKLMAMLPPAGAPGTPIVAVVGMAGVGKTTLAVHWAHRVAHLYPDGQLYLDLRGFEPGAMATPPGEALHALLEGLGLPPAKMPSSFASQVGAYRSALADRRVLLLLDNARDAEQVRPLLPGTPGCLVVVTSRDALGGLVAAANAVPLKLAPLTRHESRLVLTSRLGVSRVAADVACTEAIVDRCGGLPLALAIVAAQAVVQPGLSLSELMNQLTDGDQLGPFSSRDPATDIRRVFRWSYDSLTPTAADIFRQLGLLAEPLFAAEAVASVAGIPLPTIRPHLRELTDAHLIEERHAGRYTWHDLVRAYAAELSTQEDPKDQRAAAGRRLLDHYLHTARAASHALDVGRMRITAHPARPGVTAGTGFDSRRALEWFRHERTALIGAARGAAAAGLHHEARSLASALTEYFDMCGQFADWVAVHDVVLHCGPSRGYQFARLHRDLGRAHVRLGLYGRAEEHYVMALAEYVQLNDSAGQALTHRGLGWMYGCYTQYRKALSHCERALTLLESIGDTAGQARALNAMGWHRALLGELLPALDDCERALTLQREIGDRLGQANTLDSLGLIQLRLGQHDDAIRYYRSALALFRESGDRYDEADTLGRLGEALHAAGHVESAARTRDEAHRILREIGAPS